MDDGRASPADSSHLPSLELPPAAHDAQPDAAAKAPPADRQDGDARGSDAELVVRSSSKPASATSAASVSSSASPVLLAQTRSATRSTNCSVTSDQLLHRAAGSGASAASAASAASTASAASVTPAPAPARAAEKASVKDRLRTYFSGNRDSPRLEPTVKGARPPVSPGLNPASPPERKVPSRTPSQRGPPDKSPRPGSTKPAALKPATGGVASGPTSRDGAPVRFQLNDALPGGHEHFLKSSRRQETLSDMWKSLLGRKQEQQLPENDLSLVSSWVDTLRREKDTAEKKTGAGAVDTSGNSNSTTSSTPSLGVNASLVEKYGKCQEVVGRGAFGIVRISHKRVENKGGEKTEKLFAVKEFRRRTLETEKKYSKRLTAEFCISSSLRHPNVIHTLDLLKDAKGDYCEVMEYCAGGDLYTLVLSAGKLDTVEADCLFKQTIRGVEYMHEMGVAHRDLKPENLLLTTRGAIKITDFGNGECFRMAWEKSPHMVSGLCGSGPYIAPEEYTDKEFDARAVDVWACGVIYMAMRTGRHLWRLAKKDEDEFYDRYLEGRKDEFGYGPIEALHRARCRNVIYSILDPNPSRRLTASQVLKSEWGREIKLCKAGEEGL